MRKQHAGPPQARIDRAVDIIKVALAEMYPDANLSTRAVMRETCGCIAVGAYFDANFVIVPGWFDADYVERWDRDTLGRPQ